LAESAEDLARRVLDVARAEALIVKVRDVYRRLFGEELSRPGVKDEHLARAVRLQ
jgi:hypothetical protein